MFQNQVLPVPTNHCTILALYIYIIISLWPLSFIFIIFQLGPPFGALFFPYWAGQIGPSIASRISFPMALMHQYQVIFGQNSHFGSFWAFSGYWVGQGMVLVYT